MNDRQKRDAKYVAGGTAAGAAFMPVRQKNNAKVNPFKGMPEGVHTVPMKDMHKIARKTGKRLENKRYTARMAQSIVNGTDNGHLHKPAQVLLRDDGSARQSSGAHRLWAQTMAGEQHTGIEVHHVHGPRTTEPLYNRAGKDIGQAIQQHRLKKGPWSAGKINETAGKLHDWADKKNRAHIGGRPDVVDPLKEIGPSTARLRTKQGAVLAAGATAGLAASALRDSDKKKVSKREMNDEELRARRRAQGHITRTTSTLGLTATGLLGTTIAMKKNPRFAAKVATTPGLRRLGSADQIREKAQNVGIVAGGIGGVGGFNTAAIYREEGRHKVKKDYDIGEPTYGEVAKRALDTEEKKRGALYGGVGGFLGAPGAAIGSAIAAPPGRKVEGATAGAVGGFVGGPIGGAVGGHYSGSLHGEGSSMSVKGRLHAMKESHQAKKAVVEQQKQGAIKVAQAHMDYKKAGGKKPLTTYKVKNNSPVSKSVSAFGIEHND